MSKYRISRRMVVTILLSVAVVAASRGVGRADDDSKPFVMGRGTSFQSGFTKHFAFSVTHRNSSSLAARGFAKVRQLSAPPSSGPAFSNFSFRARITCVRRVDANRAVIGMVIVTGDGTATGQQGNSIHLMVKDGEPTNEPDLFDNTGYGLPGQPPDCTQPFVEPNGIVLEEGEIVGGGKDHD